MKKIIFLFMLLLTCCGPKPTPKVVDLSLVSHSAPTADWSGYTPSIEAFTKSGDCPHLCWLGINPEVTPASDAYQILMASDQIDQKSLQATATGIVAKWYTEKSRKLNSSVYLLVENDHVKSISFDGFAPFKIKDITNLLGDPYGIIIDMDVTGDIMDMPYETYYSGPVILVGSDAADTGPNANDGLLSFSMNIKYDDKLFRPWIGYGHLKEYFAGKEVHQHSPNP